jgi:DMSO/TMAO reductase YedYZ molybdopterin-dependent catalytic subunit
MARRVGAAVTAAIVAAVYTTASTGSKHGTPLRLRNEVQLGFKQVKWVKGVEFVAHYSEIGGGHGGYNQDHEFFGYRQAI